MNLEYRLYIQKGEVITASELSTLVFDIEETAKSRSSSEREKR